MRGCPNAGSEVYCQQILVVEFVDAEGVFRWNRSRNVSVLSYLGEERIAECLGELIVGHGSVI